MCKITSNIWKEKKKPDCFVFACFAINNIYFLISFLFGSVELLSSYFISFVAATWIEKSIEKHLYISNDDDDIRPSVHSSSFVRTNRFGFVHFLFSRCEDKMCSSKVWTAKKILILALFELDELNMTWQLMRSPFKCEKKRSFSFPCIYIYLGFQSKNETITFGICVG